MTEIKRRATYYLLSIVVLIAVSTLVADVSDRVDASIVLAAKEASEGSSTNPGPPGVWTTRWNSESTRSNGHSPTATAT